MHNNENKTPELEGLEKTIDRIINSLIQHEKKLDNLIITLEEKITEIDPEELKQYGAVSIHDKRSQNLTNFGQIIERKIGINGFEITTDRGYTLCLSGDCIDINPILKTEYKEKTQNFV